MTDNQATRLQALAQQREPIFVLGVIWVVGQPGALILENGLCFLE
jgi:hypothetical protein